MLVRHNGEFSGQLGWGSFFLVFDLWELNTGHEPSGNSHPAG